MGAQNEDLTGTPAAQVTYDNQPPIKLAFILDGEVADVIHTDDRLSAIFLSNPLVINVTDQFNNDATSVLPGYKYDSTTGTFTKP